MKHVKPERDENNRPTRRENWWIFGEPISTFRPALHSVRRYIATPETAKHRFFVFLDASILPDNMLINIAAGNLLRTSSAVRPNRSITITPRGREVMSRPLR